MDRSRDLEWSARETVARSRQLSHQAPPQPDSRIYSDFQLPILRAGDLLPLTQQPHAPDAKPTLHPSLFDTTYILRPPPSPPGQRRARIQTTGDLRDGWRPSGRPVQHHSE